MKHNFSFDDVALIIIDKTNNNKYTFGLQLGVTW